MTASSKAPFKDRIIPWYFVLFFVILAIVNIIFVTLATQSHPGIVQENAYETGLKYNDIIAASEAQSKLGWQTLLTIEDNNKIILNIKDKQNKLLSDAIIKIAVKSVLNTKQEIFLSLSEVGQGRYIVPITFPHKGQWDIYAAISKNGDVMQIHKRFLINEPE